MLPLVPEIFLSDAAEVIAAKGSEGVVEGAAVTADAPVVADVAISDVTDFRGKR